ncbi:hypothetical protein [Arenimonas sp. MALMAid1274]|uniref:hypothetical protein n=1 Tax=Arenimonas sp. MALMAid1274 TaxID=3411630 RepID=UPI003BA2AEE0
MSLFTRKGGARTVTPRSKGLSEADVPGGLPKKQREKRARNQAAVETTMGTKTAKLHADDMRRFVRDNPVPRDVAGIPDQKVVLDAIARTAKDFEGRTITVDQFIGRLWERLMLRAPSVHGRLADPLNNAIRMQAFFLGRIHSATVQVDPRTGRLSGGTGFFDASGQNVYLTDEGRAALVKRTQALGTFASAHPDVLAKKGLVYADRFRIGGRDYVDGALLMPFEGRYIVLLRIEAKTKFSGGVDSQLGAFFPRLASAGVDQKIECYINGVHVDNLARRDLLFNPTWTDSGVGVQEWDESLEAWKDARAWTADATPDGLRKPQASELGDRLDRSGRRLARLPAAQRPAFIDAAADTSSRAQLSALSTSGQVLYAKADMRPMRNWLLRAVRRT